MLKFVRSKVTVDSGPYGSNSLPRTKKKYGCSCSSEDKLKPQTIKQPTSLSSLSAQILSTSVRRRKLRQIMSNHTSQEPTSIPVQCLAQFTAESEREIDCEKLQNLRALHASGEWLYVQNEQGGKGYIPLDYCAVDLSETIPPKPAPRARNRRMRRSNVGSRSPPNKRSEDEATSGLTGSSSAETAERSSNFIRSGSTLLSALDKDVDVYWSFNMLDHNLSERWSQISPATDSTQKSPSAATEDDSPLSFESSELVLGDEAQHCTASEVLCRRRSRSIPNLSLAEPAIPGSHRLTSDSGLSHEVVGLSTESRVLDLSPGLKQPKAENDDSDYESYSSLSEECSRTSSSKQRRIVRFSLERDDHLTHRSVQNGQWMNQSTHKRSKNSHTTKQLTNRHVQNHHKPNHSTNQAIPNAQIPSQSSHIRHGQTDQSKYRHINLDQTAPRTYLPSYQQAVASMHEKIGSSKCLSQRSSSLVHINPDHKTVHGANLPVTKGRNPNEPITSTTESNRIRSDQTRLALPDATHVRSDTSHSCLAMSQTTENNNIAGKGSNSMKANLGAMQQYADDTKSTFVIVTHDYVAREEGELTVRQGVVLRLRNTFGSQWCFVCTFSGQRGFLPARCLLPYHGPDSMV